MLLGSAVLLKPELMGAVWTGAPPHPPNPHCSSPVAMSSSGVTARVCGGWGPEWQPDVGLLPTGMGEGKCPLREPESPHLGNFLPKDKAPNLPGSLMWLPEKDSLALVKAGGKE